MCNKLWCCLSTLWPPNYPILFFTHLKLCLADAIHNFKWVKIIKIWQNGGQFFLNLADRCHILSLTCLKCGTYCANKTWKPEYMRHWRLKGWHGSLILLRLCKLFCWRNEYNYRKKTGNALPFSYSLASCWYIGLHVYSKYLFIIVTCIYKHNINIHIMVINSIICRANLAYNVTLYTNIAKEKRIQCGKHYRYKQVFLFDHALHKKFSVSLQYLVIKKVNFCSKLKLMKSALLRIILFI